MRIIHSLSPAEFGGLESVVEALAMGQVKAGHCVKVVTTVSRNHHNSGSHGHPVAHPYTSRLRTSGIDVMEIPTSSRNVLKQRNAILSAIREFQPDIFHSHGYRSDILDLPSARSCGIASVSTLHGFTGGDWKMRIYESLQMQTLKRKADAVVAVSSGIRDRAARTVDISRIHLIPNAFTKDLEEFEEWDGPVLQELDSTMGQKLDSTILQRSDRRTRGLPSSTEARHRLNLPAHAIIIGWIGRISKEKGPDILIESFARLQSRIQAQSQLLSDAASWPQRPVLLSIIGDGPMLNGLRDRVAELGIADQIIFHGSIPSAGELIPAYDILTLTSRTEGTPIVLLEAMAARVPIVATAVGGVPELLSDHEGRLVEPAPAAAPHAPSSSFSTAQMFATALFETVTDPTGRRDRAALAFDRLKTSFSLSPWLERYETLYHSLIKRS